MIRLFTLDTMVMRAKERETERERETAGQMFSSDLTELLGHRVRDWSHMTMYR